MNKIALHFKRKKAEKKADAHLAGACDYFKYIKKLTISAKIIEYSWNKYDILTVLVEFTRKRNNRKRE